MYACRPDGVGASGPVVSGKGGSELGTPLHCIVLYVLRGGGLYAVSVPGPVKAASGPVYMHACVWITPPGKHAPEA